ncbi:hypothetical protein [Aureimonas sp. D3]|uniref:hypothetical protein n=1 Tax=Aureimonas sp. D3 TaxID=1638164 RepID=UPI000782F3C8|nr:hypothetical protein [Aureimonas sp. D3]
MTKKQGPVDSSQEPTSALPSDPLETFKLFIGNTAEEVERHLSVPAGSIAGIVEDEDNLFLIKLIAVIEPVINDLIRFGFLQPNGGLGGRDRGPELEPTFRELDHLPLMGRPGRLQIACKLNVITSDELQFVQALAALRNSYAHNISSMSQPILDVFRRHRAGNKKLLSVLTLNTVFTDDVDSSGELRFLLLAIWAAVLSGWMGRLHRPPQNIFDALLGLSKHKPSGTNMDERPAG